MGRGAKIKPIIHLRTRTLNVFSLYIVHIDIVHICIPVTVIHVYISNLGHLFVKLMNA